MKVAIFLRGHKRVWDHIKHNALEFYQSLGSRVDFYLAVWDVLDIDIDSLPEDFPENSVQAFLKNSNHEQYDAVTGPIFQSRLLSEYKYKREREIGKYDLVIDTRYDVFYHSINLDRYRHEISAYKDRLGSTAVFPTHSIGMDDHFFMTNSQNELLWNQRGIVNKAFHKENTHKTFYQFAVHYDLRPYTIPWFSTVIVRPNICGLKKEDICSSNYKVIEQLSKDWGQENFDKASVLNSGGFKTDEYYTQLENFS